MTDAKPVLIAVDHDPFAGAALAGFLPITPSQSEIWLSTALDPQASPAYNEGLCLHLRGNLRPDVLEKALRIIVERHDSLRAVFSPDGRWMCIRESIALDVTVHDLSGRADPAAALKAVSDQAMLAVFDLEQDALIRFELYRTAPDKHHLLFIAHHIICDGWSSAQIMVEIGALYSAGVQGQAMQMPYPAPSFADYARIESDFMRSEEGQAHRQYWLQALENPPPALQLPADRPPSAIRTYAADRYDHRLPAELADEIRRFGGAQGSSLVMTLLACFCAQLHRLTGSPDFIVGLAAAGQSFHEQPQLVGHCVNLLPLRIRPEASQSFEQLLLQVRQCVLDAFDHQGTTFGSLIPQLHLERESAKPTLISVAFNIDVRDDDVSHTGLSVDYDTLIRKSENFELFINVVDNGRDLVLECAYNSELFDAQTIRRRLREYETLLRSFSTHFGTALRDLPLIPVDERHRLLEEFNPVPEAIPPDGLHELIARNILRRPDAVAVEFRNQQLSYAELGNRADAIAATLRALGIGPGDFVAVCLPRGLDLPAALLGVLKSGAAYLPLDPEQPPARLRFMFDDAKARLMLCEKSTAKALGDGDVEAQSIDAIGPHAGASIDTAVAASSPAYVIYTSGSTGTPKGVVVPHGAIVNCLYSTCNSIAIDENDTQLAVATIAFDASVLDIFLPLLHGARLAIVSSDEAMDGASLAAAIERHRVTRLFTVPAVWRLLLAAGWDGKADLIGCSAAEPLTADLAASLLPRLAQLWNLYGPTEAAVWTLGVRITDSQAPITVGRPISNTRVYILDAAGQPVPAGVTGELFIGGAGVAIGYLNQPELTAERFVADPFAAGRMYRTGDLAKWTEQGDVICLGRRDFQVKLRGFRIELGEIESALQAHPAVAEAVCGVRNQSAEDPRLIAWVEQRPGSLLNAGELRQYLRASLPRYMVPQQFVIVGTLPRLPSGKLDRSKLPDPFGGKVVTEAVAVPPRTEIEQRIARIWQDLLGHQNIGIADRFLDIGGHSLLAVRATAQLREAFGIKLMARDVMTQPLAELARMCGDQVARAEIPIEKAEPAKPLAPPQKPAKRLIRLQKWLGL